MALGTWKVFRVCGLQNFCLYKLPPRPGLYSSILPSFWTNEHTEVWGTKLSSAGQSSAINPATSPEPVISIAGFTQKKTKTNKQKKKTNKQKKTAQVVKLVLNTILRNILPPISPPEPQEMLSKESLQLFRFLASCRPTSLPPWLYFLVFLVECQHPDHPYLPMRSLPKFSVIAGLQVFTSKPIFLSFLFCFVLLLLLLLF